MKQERVIGMIPKELQNIEIILKITKTASSVKH